MSLVQEEPVTGAQPGRGATITGRRRIGPAALRRALREILLVAVLFLAYKVGRIAAAGHVDAAMDNARKVWDFERWLHLPSEYAFQHALIDQEWLIRAMNCYYAYVHFPLTTACLIGLYIWRPDHYVPTRRLLAWLTASALVVHLLMPLAPPRMLSAVGLVDTGRLLGPTVYGSPTSDTLTNQYAAMPSLHVGWALAIAIALIGATKSRWRWLWLAHPVITLLVVVVTGNHYWVDAIVVVALLGAVMGLQRHWDAISRRAEPAPQVPRQRLVS
jgi:PAP2 superfamily